MQTKSLTAAFMFCSALLVAGCAGNHTTHGAAQYSDDTAMDEAVTTAIHSKAGSAAHAVRVSTSNGVVTLSGNAPSQAVAQDAIEAARHVPGVKKVDYDINVDQSR